MSDNAMHSHDKDYRCERCGMWVETHIEHECDPSICYGCNGTGKMWKRGWVRCDRCLGQKDENTGDGKTNYDWKPPEENTPVPV